MRSETRPDRGRSSQTISEPSRISSLSRKETNLRRRSRKSRKERFPLELEVWIKMLERPQLELKAFPIVQMIKKFRYKKAQPQQPSSPQVRPD